MELSLVKTCLPQSQVEAELKQPQTDDFKKVFEVAEKLFQTNCSKLMKRAEQFNIKTDKSAPLSDLLTCLHKMNWTAELQDMLTSEQINIHMALKTMPGVIHQTLVSLQPDEDNTSWNVIVQAAKTENLLAVQERVAKMGNTKNNKTNKLTGKEDDAKKPKKGNGSAHSLCYRCGSADHQKCFCPIKWDVISCDFCKLKGHGQVVC